MSFPNALLPDRVWALIAPVWLAGAATLGAAVAGYSAQHGADLATIAALFAASILAERFPVPIRGVDAGGVSLGFVFAAAAVVLVGWEAAVLVTATAPALVQALERRPLVRVAFNASVFALGALLAGAAIHPIDGSRPISVLGQVIVAFAALFLVDWLLVNLAIALHSGRRYAGLLRTTLQEMVAPAALMASAALMLVVLWQRSPFFSIALFGPLIAIALYQRSQLRELGSAAATAGLAS